MIPSFIITPVGTSISVSNGSSELVSFGGLASYVQMTNNSSGPITVWVNNLSSAAFTLAGNSIQIFNPRDLQITSLNFVNSLSGGSTVDVSLLYGLYN